MGSDYYRRLRQERRFDPKLISYHHNYKGKGDQDFTVVTDKNL